MKTVKRKAEVGERILVNGGFGSGESGKVISQHDSGEGVWVKLGGLKVAVVHGHYEVIIEDELKRVHPKPGTGESDDLDYGEPMGSPIPPHSSHYHQNGLDPLEVMRRTFPPEQYEGFLRGSLLKYTMRYDRKGQEAEDLEKMNFYGKELEVFKRQQHD